MNEGVRRPALNCEPIAGRQYGFLSWHPVFNIVTYYNRPRLRVVTVYLKSHCNKIGIRFVVVAFAKRVDKLCSA